MRRSLAIVLLVVACVVDISVNGECQVIWFDVDLPLFSIIFNLITAYSGKDDLLVDYCKDGEPLIFSNNFVCDHWSL